MIDMTANTILRRLVRDCCDGAVRRDPKTIVTSLRLQAAHAFP
jgi:hypothetical protein